jgi:hypothetical protein
MHYHNGTVANEEGGGLYVIKSAGGATVVVEFSGFNAGQLPQPVLTSCAPPFRYPK